MHASIFYPASPSAKPTLTLVAPWVLLALLGFSACHRASHSRPTTKSRLPSPGPVSTANATPALPNFAVDAVATREGEAFWYDVPDQSLPQRRAWVGELTAASDSLPLNTYARVRRLDGTHQDKPIVVRITDQGIHHRGGLIDVNRDAAEALGMVKIGKARVRVETLALKNATTDKPVDKKDEPVAPKALELNGKAAAGARAEKDAANAKTGGTSAP